MTIKKSYRFQIEHEDGSIEDVIFKGRTEPEAREALKQEYPDLDWYDWGDRLKLPRRDRLGTFSRVFYNSCRRGAQFIYQHKGRKKRGRKNYPTPKRGWRRPLGPMSFTFTETVSMSVRSFLDKWTGFIAQDLGITFPEIAMQQQNEKTVPVIVIDSLGMLPEVQAEYAACPPCAPVSAIDELGRAIKDLNIGDQMATHIPTDAELVASGDPNDPLTRALQCRIDGDYTGMMHNAAQVPEIMDKLRAKGLVV